MPALLPQGEHVKRPQAGAFSRSALTNALECHAGAPDELAHDARNVISGLMLYSDLLAVPGVLTKKHTRYAHDLQNIVHIAAQIVERMEQRMAVAQKPNSFPDVPLSFAPVTDLADELHHLQPLLAAIAGPAMRLSIETMPCPGRTGLTVEDLTRILVNLVRNAADAMPTGGNIHITARCGDKPTDAFTPPHSIVLTVTDNGPGIPASLRDRIFDPGFSTRSTTPPDNAEWHPPRRRGIGLSIVRNLVEAAGGRVRATCAPCGGARFEITLPFLQDSITSGTCSTPPHCAFPADSHGSGCIELH